jgi:hypothetical protein
MIKFKLTTIATVPPVSTDWLTGIEGHRALKAQLLTGDSRLALNRESRITITLMSDPNVSNHTLLNFGAVIAKGWRCLELPNVRCPMNPWLLYNDRLREEYANRRTELDTLTRERRIDASCASDALSSASGYIRYVVTAEGQNAIEISLLRGELPIEMILATIYRMVNTLEWVASLGTSVRLSSPANLKRATWDEITVYARCSTISARPDPNSEIDSPTPPPAPRRRRPTNDED